MELLVEKVGILVPCPKVAAPVGLNVGILVGTKGAIFVLRPVGTNEVLAKVGSPVPAPVPVCARLGKKEGLNVGMNVFAPAPVPAMVAVPVRTGKLEGKPVNFFVGATEGNRVPKQRLDTGFCTKSGPNRCDSECGFVRHSARAGASTGPGRGRVSENTGQNPCKALCGFVGRRTRAGSSRGPGSGRVSENTGQNPCKT